MKQISEDVMPMAMDTTQTTNRASGKKRKIDASEVGKLDKGSKEERREAKRIRKLKEAEETNGTSASDSAANGNTVAQAKDAAKAARRAEKARRKALKAGENGAVSNSEHSPEEPNAPTEAEGTKDAAHTEVEKVDSKAARKAEKARLKALKKAENNAPSKEANGAADAVPSTSGSTGGIPTKEQTPDVKWEKQVRKVSKPSQTGTNGHIMTTVAISNYQEHPTLSALPQPEIDTFLTSNFITITDPSSSTTLRPIISFSHLPTSALTQPSLFSTFKNPTPVQSAAWPFILSGRDVIGVAETGSGKTLAFGVPCIRYISSLPYSSQKGSTARAVIVSPTRELAVQIHDQLIQLATPAGLKTVCVYGGVPKDAQRQALRTAHIVVATPGRLNDLINEGSADLSNVGYVVLDEADRMLDKGFEEEIRKIISTTPSPSPSGKDRRGRQTLMFTATWPPSVRDLAATFMRSPVKIAIGDNPTGELRANTSITQRVEVVLPYDKEARLLQLLKQHSSPKEHTRILVFCLYKKEASRIELFLRGKGLKVAGIHGDMSQEKRSASLEAFKKDKGVPVLVATDVAARGLDIPAVKVVINVTFPLTVEDYVHRIGRTGRAGATGLAITLFTEHDKAQSGALINVLKAAGQPVPDELLKFGTTVKKKGHEAYGAFYKDTGEVTKAATKIRFD
ncbi:RNA-dependent ATPase [Trapelia coarctata]|nr:RNA-dependent ATPase [Trapelia coarctata]